MCCVLIGSLLAKDVLIGAANHADLPVPTTWHCVSSVSSISVLSKVTNDFIAGSPGVLHRDHLILS